MIEKYLNPQAVAKMLDVSPTTVRSWLRSGSLKGIKLGGGKLWRIKETEINEFLYKHKDSYNGS